MTSLDLASSSNSSSQSSLASAFKHAASDERNNARSRPENAATAAAVIGSKLGKLAIDDDDQSSDPLTLDRRQCEDSDAASLRSMDSTCKPKLKIKNLVNKTAAISPASSSGGLGDDERGAGSDGLDHTVSSGNDATTTECRPPLVKRIDSKRTLRKNKFVKQLSDRLYEQQQHQQQHHQSDSQSFDLNNKTSLIVTDDENQSGDKINPTKVSLTNSLTDVNEDLINEKNNEIGRVTKWATGFEKLLEDPLGLQIFTEFLKKEFSEENIDFWVKCENFKKLSDPEQMKHIAQDIWNIYLDTSSMRQINVDNKARSICKDALQQPNNTMFETAQTQIFALMKYDSYSRFLKSQMYKDCIVNEMEGKPLLSTTSNTTTAAVAVVASTGAAVLSSSSVHSSQSQQQSQTSLSSPTSTAPSPFALGAATVGNQLNSLPSSSLSILSNQSSSSPLALGTLTSSSLNVNAASAAALSPSSSSSLTASNLISTGASGLALSSGNLNTLNNNSATSAGANANNTVGDRKEKKRSTIIPWTKAFIKWKRLSGKDTKKAAGMTPGSVVNADALPVFPAQSQTPTLTSGVAATLVKGFGHKTPLILSNHTFGQSSQSNNPPAAVQTLSQMTESNILQQSLELSNLQPSSLCNVIEQKFCRVLCNDGSSTMIQVSPGLTVYQALTKIFAKKQIPWYKCDIYFVSDYQPVDQQMDSQALGSKEIYLEERCLFALSLIPIAINICVKGNLKKSINSVLQPILDSYQIKYTNCAVYLNSANYTLNLSELCATIDNQHVLVVHKHQSNLLSQMEIEKFMSVSINDFIPANFQDYQMQFDELGILKKCIQIKQKPGSTISTFNPPNSVTVSLSTSPNSPGILSTAPVPIPSPVCALMTQQVQTQPPLQTPPQPSQQVPQTAQLLHVTSAGQISVQQSQPAQPQIQHIRLGLKSVNEEQEV